MRWNLYLKDAEATIELGRILADFIAQVPIRPALLLQGDLGSGKTTLIRGLVASLPGAEQAEVSSPSFNICNLYPTVPNVAHFDLYRLEGMPPDDMLLEQMDAPDTLTVVEWAQFLDKRYWPDEALLLTWSPRTEGRSLDMELMGKATQDHYQFLSTRLTSFTESTE